MSVIVLAGGGTGGHVYLALAIGDVLKARGHKVLYYGDKERLEGRVAPERGYEFREVHALQYPRAGLLGKVRFAFGLLRSTWATRAMLAHDHVDAVLGVGGYISAPPVLAAWVRGAARVIHEANAVPGLANKLCARVAQSILLTFEQTRNQLPGSAPRTVVGVPVNKKILDGQRADAKERYGLDPSKPIVVFVGGSLGAQRLNELAIACGKDTDRAYQILHVTGAKYYADVKAAWGELPPGVCVRDYENQMGTLYAAADLIVCRAGSSTLAELCATGKASLLIPSPNVTDNHQEENARGLEKAGAADVLVEHGWDVAAAVARVRALAQDPGRLAAMGTAARGQAKLDAAERAADVVEALLKR